MVKPTQMIRLKKFLLLYLFSSHQSQAGSVPQQCLCAAPRVSSSRQSFPDTINQTLDLEQDDFLSEVFI